MIDIGHWSIAAVDTTQCSESSKSCPFHISPVSIYSSSRYVSHSSVCSDVRVSGNTPIDLSSQQDLVQGIINSDTNCNSAVQRIEKSLSLTDIVLCDAKHLESVGEGGHRLSLTTSDQDSLFENPVITPRTDQFCEERCEVFFFPDSMAPMDTLSVPGCILPDRSRKNVLATQQQPINKKSSLFTEQRQHFGNSMPELEHIVCDQPLPRSVSTVSRISSISQRFLQRWNSRRFQRTMCRRKRTGPHDVPMVTSYAMAEDYLSLSIILSLICVPVNPLCLFFIIPSLVISTKVYCEQQKGTLKSDDIRLDIVALLLCIVLIGGAVIAILTATIVTVVCVCT